MSRNWRTLAVALLTPLAAACAGSVYELPEPPSQGEQGEVAVDPAQEAENERKRYLAARTSLLELYSALSKERFEEAESLLSQQTRDFLSSGTDSGDPSQALSEGELVLPDGRTIEIDPVSFLIAPSVARIVDTAEGVEEHETSRRRELFVVDEQGEQHRVVLIVEGDQWVVHKTAVEPEDLE